MNTKEYAIKCHSDVNQIYDVHPYSYHLQMVEHYALKYKHLVHSEDLDDVLSACWAHDVIEDCRQTYNDVKKVCGEKIAEMVYALTNEKGKTRLERENTKYFDGIKATPNATFVKLCDRLSNIKYSVDNKSSMGRKYKKEFGHFIENLYDPIYKEMFDEMEMLLNKI